MTTRKDVKRPLAKNQTSMAAAEIEKILEGAWTNCPLCPFRFFCFQNAIFASMETKDTCLRMSRIID